MELMWVDEVQFEDQLIEAMTRPLTGPGSASAPPPLLVAYPPIEWVPAGEEEGFAALEDVLMLRMINGEGSILHFGMLRNGSGFRATSGYDWMKRRFVDDDLAAEVVAAEIDGYHLDYGPVSFPVSGAVAEGISRGRFVGTSIVLLERFQEAGAPNI
jgi:hypothetical protein